MRPARHAPGVFVSGRSGAPPRYNRAVPDAPYETLLHEMSDGVATVTLNRPDSLNALNAEMRRELLAAVKSARADDATRVLVLTGAGRGFCAGADLKGGSGERDFRRVLTQEYNPLIAAIRALSKPVVASVNGVAAGAGMSLAFAADIVIASDEARFIPAFSRIGLVPDSGLTRTLVLSLGRHRALEFLLGERQLTAAAAQDAGLVAAVVPSERLAGATAELGRRLAAGPIEAIGMTKRLVNRAEDASLDELLEMEAALQEVAGRGAEHAEGVAAFREKREPRFERS